MAKYLEIQSADNTDMIVLIDKVQYVVQKADCCIIGLENGDRISTGAEFRDIKRALKV